MYIRSVIASITLIAGTISAGTAFAQSATDVVGGSFGAMTCADFSSLSHRDQASLTRDAKDNAPATSLTSNSGVGNLNADRGRGNSSNADGGYAGALGLGASLNSGQLIAACQAAPPSATLQDAFSRFTSGGNAASVPGSNRSLR